MTECPKCHERVWVKTGVLIELATIGVTVYHGAYSDADHQTMYDMVPPGTEIDDLNAVCVRCGASVVGLMTV